MAGAAAATAFDPVRAYLPRNFWNMGRDYRAYGVDFDTLAASAAAQPETFQIDVNAYFLCMSLVEVITTDTTGSTEQSFPEHRVQIGDSGSGAQWFNDFQHAANIFGRMAVDGRGVHHLPYPRLVKPGSVVRVLLNNLEANARRIWITFHGVQLYRDIRFHPPQKPKRKK